MEPDPGFAEAFLKGILEHGVDMIFAADAQGNLKALSRSGRAFLGYEWGDLADRPISEIAEDHDAWSLLLRKCRERGQIIGREVAFRLKGGESGSVELSLYDVRGPGGRQLGTLGMGRVLSTRESLQENLIRIDRMAEIGRIASGVVHEINNPLSNISQIAGWMESVIQDAGGLTPEDRQELQTAAGRIGEQIDRCRRLSHQILTFARSDAHARAAFSIHDILDRSLGFLGTELKDRGIELVLEYGHEPITVRSDPNMLEQVFVNLISNAIYAIQEKGRGGRITLRTQQSGPDVVVQIADTGVGISKDNLEKVSRLFFTTKPPGKGTGLGIPICINLLDKLGGDLTFESEEGAGATFTVRVPQA